MSNIIVNVWPECHTLTSSCNIKCFVWGHSWFIFCLSTPCFGYLVVVETRNSPSIIRRCVALYHTSTYILTSTLQCSQTLDPFTVMHTYTDLCLAHPLETWTPFDIVVNSAYALLTMPITYKPTNIVNSPFVRYSDTSAYNIYIKVYTFGVSHKAERICQSLRPSIHRVWVS